MGLLARLRTLLGGAEAIDPIDPAPTQQTCDMVGRIDGNGNLTLTGVMTGYSSGGSMGATGATGPKGDKGDTGAAGLNGTNGTPGINGTNGAAGVPGTPYAISVQIQFPVATGFSLIAPDSTANEILYALIPAATLATGTLMMPAHPTLGQRVTITSTAKVTALTVLANAGQAIFNNPNPGVLTAGVAMSWVYGGPFFPQWYRLA